MKIESVSAVELGVLSTVLFALVSFALIITAVAIASNVGRVFQRYRDSHNLKIDAPNDMDELSKMWEGESLTK